MKETFHQLIALRRSVRRFKPDPIETETLVKLVDAARLCPSAANKQPLIYLVVNDQELSSKLFGLEKFAGYLKGAGQPRQGEEPTAHILVALDKETAIAESVRDVGAAVQTILLGAVAYGLGATWLRSFDRPKAAMVLGLPERYEPDSLIALGMPDEFPKVVAMEGGDVNYWRDENRQHFVPKRSLKEICFINGFKPVQ
jgi:nitroreductase